MDNTKIHIIATGGTIDSYWDSKQDTVVVAKNSFIPEFIEKLRMSTTINVSQVCMKDSRAFTKRDLLMLKEEVENSRSIKIVVTHGTYMLPDAARYIRDSLIRKDQTIIFTGAVTPLKGFEFSEGEFNLGYAIAKVQDLQPGIYIAINSKCLPIKEIEKLIEDRMLYKTLFNQSS